MKTKLGVSVGLVGAAAFIMAMFQSYVGLLLIVGYVMLCETDVWLRRIVVKALVLTIVFDIIQVVIGYVPDAIDLINSFLRIFNGDFQISFVSNVFSFVLRALMVLYSLLTLGLTLKALTNGSLPLGPIDKMVDEHIK